MRLFINFLRVLHAFFSLRNNLNPSLPPLGSQLCTLDDVTTKDKLVSGRLGVGIYNLGTTIIRVYSQQLQTLMSVLYLPSLCVGATAVIG